MDITHRLLLICLILPFQSGGRGPLGGLHGMPGGPQQIICMSMKYEATSSLDLLLHIRMYMRAPKDFTASSVVAHKLLLYT